jgi:CubicO group peptidase (beta-lactamase class C family)
MTSTPLWHRRRAIAGLGMSALLMTWALAPAAPAATAGAEPRSAPVETSPPGLDREALRETLDAVHDAGMYGTYSGVRDGDARWNGASGVADVRTERPVNPRMSHRVGSISKTFTAVAILQQVQRGRVDLDSPVARYLPGLIPDARGQRVTVRMLLNHTSGIGDYFLGAFPSLAQGSTESLDAGRFRTISPEELVRLGLAVPPTGEPGQKWSYSNTNYIIAGLLLHKVTGVAAESYITRHVIAAAGLRHTSFPRTPLIPGPHSKAYESFYGYIDPPRDYSVYNMSWAWTAGAVVSTMDDLNRFYRALLTGRLLAPAQLAEILTTVPATDAQGNVLMHYGLGIYAQDLPCGRFWGHDGAVFGMGTIALSSSDGRRQVSLGMNLMHYERYDENGQQLPSPINAALEQHLLQALCGADATLTKSRPFIPLPTGQMPIRG